MKKLLLCISALLLIAFASIQAFAWWNVGVVGGQVPAAGGGEPTTIDSYSTTNYNTSNQLQQYDLLGLGQSITGDGTSLTEFYFYLSKVGTPTGNATISVYAHTGTFGTSSLPTGSALSSTTINVSTEVTGSFTLVKATFSSPATLTDGVNYVVVILYNDESSNGANYLLVGDDNSSPTHGGNLVYTTNGSTWNAVSSEDNIFNAIHTP